jgi:hypothetical protein
MKYLNFLLFLSLGLSSISACAYVQQRSNAYPQSNEQRAEQNEGYQQQIDHNSPEGTEGYMSQGPGYPHEGPDGTEYPSNNLQDDDPE